MTQLCSGSHRKLNQDDIRRKRQSDFVSVMKANSCLIIPLSVW